jgi:hypothetical protein
LGRLSVEEQAVKVGVAAEVAGGAMDCGDRAALAVGNAPIRLPLAIVDATVSVKMPLLPQRRILGQRVT